MNHYTLSTRPHIFLIGFMGCGKTYWGSRLAQHIGYVFVDLDHLIEQTIGQTIAEYFKEHGETAFRLVEKQILQQANFPTKAVISCGGGTPCFFDNMAWMNKNGITIYLHLPISVLADRILQSETERPLTQGKNKEELITFIENKMKERESFYLQAQHQLEGLNLNLNQWNKLLKFNL